MPLSSNPLKCVSELNVIEISYGVSHDPCTHRSMPERLVNADAFGEESGRIAE
jgi:hypothetical protein